MKTSNWDKNIVYDSDCWIVFEDRPHTDCSGDCWHGMTVAEIEAMEGKEVLSITKIVCVEKTIYKKPRLEKENKKAKVVCC